jgi:hypothetical protein
MAITIEDQPYTWALRGQKLMIVATSDEIAQVGFKYGVEVNVQGVPYSFYLNPAPDDRLYFDMNPLLDTMRNVEPQNFHFATDNTQIDSSGITLTFTLTEWNNIIRHLQTSEKYLTDSDYTNNCEAIYWAAWAASTIDDKIEKKICKLHLTSIED